MRKKLNLISLSFAIAGVAVMAPQFVAGKAQGPCVDCHTMHNSQNGIEHAEVPSGLLTNNVGCLGCHTGINKNGGTTPYIFSSSKPDYDRNTLAGGSFYWVSVGEDAKGHNVLGVANRDNTLNYDPPGWNARFDANTKVNGGAESWRRQLTCSGTRGCHGVHDKPEQSFVDDYAGIAGAHHADDSIIDGSNTGKSYRFLLGIIGKEDSDWEYRTSPTDHNQYYGYRKTNDIPPAPGSEAAKSINYLCAECHGNFHSGKGELGTIGGGNEAASAWLRHPTDCDINALSSGSEYKHYGNQGLYQPHVPVATDNTTTINGRGVVTDIVGNVFERSGDGIVTCISCHRAHGSPYADLLRWDYDTCEAGSDNAKCGCFECHTAKDAS